MRNLFKIITIIFLYIFLCIVKTLTFIVLCINWCIRCVKNTKAYVRSLFTDKPQLTTFKPRGFIYYKHGKIWADEQELWQKMHRDLVLKFKKHFTYNESTRTSK
jgi:hypothetical protein